MKAPADVARIAYDPTQAQTEGFNYGWVADTGENFERLGLDRFQAAVEAFNGYRL